MNNNDDDGSELKNQYFAIPTWIMELQMPLTERVLLGLVHSLSGERGYCYAKNAYLARMLGIDPDWVRAKLRMLKGLHFIEVRLIFAPGTKEVQERRIFPESDFHKLGTLRCEKKPPVSKHPTPSVDTPLPSGVDPSVNNQKNNNQSNTKCASAPPQLTSEKTEDEFSSQITEELKIQFPMGSGHLILAIKDALWDNLLMRREQRHKKKTIVGWRRNMKEWEGRPEEFLEAVRFSTAQGYQGIFPAKGNSNASKASTNNFNANLDMIARLEQEEKTRGIV